MPMQRVSEMPCPNDKPGKQCFTTDLATLIYAGETLVLNIGRIMPELKKIFRCAYIGYLAEASPNAHGTAVWCANDASLPASEC